MPVNSLRDKIDGNELDLSLCSLEVVPLKELKELPKATHLDMSCNVLVTIPKDFCLLSHLVRLDLSKNKITTLPQNFGNLAKLQYLDLYENELTTLPISMCRLDKLRWLDVKDNPIHDTLKSVAGDCLNEAQCRSCAKNIVAFMKKADSQQEKERQLRLQAEREQEKKRKAEEDKEKERIRQKKKQEKERKRQLHEEKMRAQREQEAEEARQAQVQNGKAPKTTPKTKPQAENGGGYCCGVLLSILVCLIAIVTGLCYYCTIHPKEEHCKQVITLTAPYVNQSQQIWLQLVDKAQELFTNVRTQLKS